MYIIYWKFKFLYFYTYHNIKNVWASALLSYLSIEQSETDLLV